MSNAVFMPTTSIKPIGPMRQPRFMIMKVRSTSSGVETPFVTSDCAAFWIGTNHELST